MKRRFVCLVLILCMCTVCSAPAFAVESADDRKPDVMEKKILDEIEAKKAETMMLVYEQLEAQGKTHMISDYEEVLFPEIEALVYSKYGVETVSHRSSAPQYRFTYGGTIANITSSGRKAVSTYMDRDNSYYYILSVTDWGTVTANTIIGFILGRLPRFSEFFTALFTVATGVSPGVKLEIRDAGGYARILTLSGDDYSSVLLPWETYPYAIPYAYDPAALIEWEVFPESDPFD